MKSKGISALFLLEFYKALIVHYLLVSLEEIIGLGVAMVRVHITRTDESYRLGEKPKILLFIATEHKFVSVLLVGNLFCFI